MNAKDLIASWKKWRIESADRMEDCQLVENYRESLKIEDNPESHIYEMEILRRLWAGRLLYRLAMAC